MLRDAISSEDKWNVGELYPNLTTWENDFQKATPQWKDLLSYKGRLGESPAVLLEAITLSLEISRHLEKLYTYAHLRHDEDITHVEHKNAYEKALSLIHQFSETFSWIEPEILSLPENTLREYLSSSILTPYLFHLEKLIRLREHTLSAAEETIIALGQRAFETAHKTFSAINNADFKFPSVIDAKGQPHEMSHGTYQIYLRSRDRVLRENAFKTLHNKYGEFENTLCELINGQVQSHLFEAKARKYQSCLEAALKPKNIELDVYHSLIQAVKEEIDALHDYTSIRKRFLRLDTLHLYDLYVPLTDEIDIQMSYEEAEEAVIASVTPLGEEYQNILKKGLKEHRWVDRYENTYKRSGAYSSGCYDSMPYILMNFKNLLTDVFTLAHEAGHSMHSFLSRKHQPYHYSSYPIFVAEVASTFNEELLMTYLKQNAKTKEEKFYLVNQQIETIRTTLFRQTLFAEFELKIHEFAEKNIPLTPSLLKEEYAKLNAEYFGPNIYIDEEIQNEWSRIPHFYYNFYVYQYATGISASIALSELVLKGSEKERSNYLSFLKGGCSEYPIDLLRRAGVNMRSVEPVKLAIKKFRSLIKDLAALT